MSYLRLLARAAHRLVPRLLAAVVLLSGSGMALSAITGLQVIVVSGPSMPPTLWNGDVLLWRPTDELPRGAVVRYWFEGRRYVHRIVGLPGETVTGRGGGVQIGDERLPEPYVVFNSAWDLASRRLGPAEYLLLQDNRAEGSIVHVIPRTAIIGQVVWVLWPPGHAGLVR